MHGRFMYTMCYAIVSQLKLFLIVGAEFYEEEPLVIYGHFRNTGVFSDSY